jgi:general secretion pathway protein K
MKRAFPRLAQRRGVALMLVLWIVIVLSAVAIGVAAVARTQTRSLQNARLRAAARYAAESGVVAATARLRAVFEEAPQPEGREEVFADFEEELAGWGERALGAARYQVALADLNARIDLNNSDDDILRALFEQLVSAGKAAELVDALEDWKDEDDEPRPEGAEAADYALAGSPFVPPNAPLLRLDELTRVKGFSDSIAEVLAPYVTVWGSGLVNANTAPQPVLAALPELGPAGAEAVLDARRRGHPVTSVVATLQDLGRRGVAGFARGVRLITLPERLLVVSRGWVEGSPLTHEVQAVVEIEDYSGPEGPRLRIVHWTERDL